MIGKTFRAAYKNVGRMCMKNVSRSYFRRVIEIGKNPHETSQVYGVSML